jgi:ABC-type bacteriocin/lantibiotic exporter with double-glycine peptidase domain
MNTAPHPSVSILHLLISHLRVRVSKSAMAAAVEAHPQPFSLACLRQALAQWRVDSLAVQLPAQDLDEVPLPAIAHLHSGNFVLLTRAEADRVVYQDVKGDTIEASLTDFGQAWSGKLLLAEAQARSKNINSTTLASYSLTIRPFAIPISSIWLFWFKVFILVS